MLSFIAKDYFVQLEGPNSDSFTEAFDPKRIKA
ncbi:hypothetical protein swp_1309 [Shewanella piezotolerans WP3]|uniref:Uncharacterized protein n=1 Tax=Shewanella piezotolerans (strain WP3 / JCM 13877) TaxID=225849 RepID=B8CJK1_SHEPW|nr:hypothetical protein swp_1309 [Shewanella piezotolerans WP3]